MNFIVNEVMEFKHIDAADSNAVFERFAGTSVEKNGFTVDIEVSESDGMEDVFFASAVEDRSSDIKIGVRSGIEAEKPDKLFVRGIVREEVGIDLCDGEAEMSFEDLPDIHTGGDAERVKNDIDGSTVREERHILLSTYFRDDAFITVSAGHFIPDGDFPFLSNINPNLSLCEASDEP